MILGVCEGIVSRVSKGLKVIIRFGCEGKGLLDVIRCWDNLIDVGGWNGTDIGHAGLICADEQKEIAGAGEFIAEFDKTRGHAVEPMIPELVDECSGGIILLCFRSGDSLFAFDVKAGADDILAGEFHDAASEGGFAPGFEALIKNIGAVVFEAVTLGFIIAAGADEKGIVGFGNGKLFSNCLFDNRREETGYEGSNWVGHGGLAHR